jgi:hypothetical protein
MVHWGIDGWRGVADTATVDTGLGLHVADLDVRTLHHGQRVNFTFRLNDTGEWAGRDFFVDAIEHAQAVQSASGSRPEEQKAPTQLVRNAEDLAI